MRVLVIEDDHVLGEAVREHVASLGYGVDWMKRLDDARDALATVTYELVLLDLNMPDGRGLDLLRPPRCQGSVVPAASKDRFAEISSGLATGERRKGRTGRLKQRCIEELQRKVLDLAQRWLNATALQLTIDIVEARWLVVEQTGSSIQWPFLVILVFWLAMILASFGLFAPANSSVMAALFAYALSVGAAIYLIVEMDQPYGGLIQISSAPIRTVLDQLGR